MAWSQGSKLSTREKAKEESLGKRISMCKGPVAGGVVAGRRNKAKLKLFHGCRDGT